MQRIIEGIANLPAILKDVNCKKLFLVADSSYPYLNIRHSIEALPFVETVLFCDFTPNPQYEQVCKGIEMFEQSGCDAILAVGGGSAIDVAKCVKLSVIASSGKASLLPPLVSTAATLKDRVIPFIAIPTTAGTGSESTHNAVMYYQGAKQTVTNDGVLPDYALLEPSVLKTLPLYQKKCTMMDALCQGIESWWSINATEESKLYSRKAIELIMASWRPYIFDNDDDAGCEIMLAANYSGRAINIAQTTAAHAMSYKITSLYGLPHGHAVALCLPAIWVYMQEALTRGTDPVTRNSLAGIFSDIAQAMGYESVNAAISAFNQMMTEMDLSKPVSENTAQELTQLVQSVNPVRLKNNPIIPTAEELHALYSEIIG